ncbi:MAG: transglutaminaseTgpA domain-containing protein [Phycisphaerales bacterium]
MDLDQTFSRIAFYQVLLGILTFCYAEANPGMLLVAGSLVVLSRYISEGPWGRPMPWWVINLLAVVAAAWMISRLVLANPNIIVTMGHFTMWLQVLVMFARKSNRDYGQVLMLSLIQMIGASVLSVSIIYGLLLGVYCVLAVLTVLIFQLKSSRDRVHEENLAAAADKRRVVRPKPVIGRGFHWHFRSAGVSVLTGCAFVAMTVFILIPRSADSTLAGESEGGLGPRQVGFSEQVRLDGPPIAQVSHEPVMNLHVERFGEPDTSSSWLLRGAALDVYDPESRTWKRSQEVASTDYRVRVNERGLNLAQLPHNAPVIRARVTLRQIGHRNLFTVLPITYFSSEGINSVVFSREDLQLSAGGAVMGAVIYDIAWPLYQGHEPQYTDQAPDQSSLAYPPSTTDVSFIPGEYARGWPIQPDRISAFARNIIAEAGLTRDPLTAYDPNDDRIARVLADYLRQNYTYQLTGPGYAPGREPVIDFLFEHHTGHCELFASALAAMTRSLGMQSRVVTGFLAGEYNQIGGYYVVRQSDAHAWVEVNLGQGHRWKSFDATPAADIDRQLQQDRNWTTILREAYEHIEFGWIRSIVAYDVGTRHALLTKIREWFKTITASQDNWLGQAILFSKTLPNAWRLDKVNTTKVLGSTALALLATAALIRSVVTRRRRLMKLKLSKLAPQRQTELARQLAFFIDMNDLLAEHGYFRPASQNPRDYALALIEERPGVMGPVLELTDLFYRVRFGGRTTDQAVRQRARVYLRQLQRGLAGRKSQ